MDVQTLLDRFSFFAGVPDSQLKALCSALTDTHGICSSHIIAANEGNATALAAGYYLSTGKVPVVYMQNSGIGNIINPVASLLNDKVYAIPCLFIVGWRGEPGVHDEPQHIYQGEVTLKLLEDMGIETFVLSPDTPAEDVCAQLEKWQDRFRAGKCAAIVVRKGALKYDKKVTYKNPYTLNREEVIRRISAQTGEGVIVSTTGKISRELFEIREARGEGHEKDFLTVGSMGHSSSIALGIALNKPHTRVWCIDGDGAVLMHMGSMALTGSNAPKNMVHVLLNNAAHETVGGMATVAGGIDFPAIAKACGYPVALKAETEAELDDALQIIRKSDCLCFLEVRVALGSREDLGRPTTTPIQNRDALMAYLRTRT